MTKKTRLGLATALSFGASAAGWAEPSIDAGRLDASAHRSVAGAITPGTVESDGVDRQAQDRRAILAMAGEYRVSFRFEETVPIAAGYEIAEPYISAATEFVEVVENTLNRIVLQHVLVLHDPDAEADAKPHVVKHWRQDWVYEERVVTEFVGRETFVTRHLDAAEVAGKWSQPVYQVDDSPRYEALGRWTHENGRSTWTSELTWRPLPRREHATRNRSDYQLLLAVNCHTLTPSGWVHGQDNQKLVLGDDGNPVAVLAHEIGINRYERTADVDFAPGRAYWTETAAFWQEVRDRWTGALAPEGRWRIATKLDDQPLYAHIFGIAEDVREAGEYKPEHREQMQAVIAASMEPASDASANSEPKSTPLARTKSC
ncbi:MAG: DUF6607 family protein [Planctomycetota bacterium]